MSEIVAARVEYFVANSFMVNDWPSKGVVTIFNVGKVVDNKEIRERYPSFLKTRLVEAKGVKIKVLKEEPKSKPETGTAKKDTKKPDKDAKK